MFHSYAITRDGMWFAIDLYYIGEKPTHADAVDHIQDLFNNRCDLTRAAIKYHDENIVSLHSVRIDGIGGFEKQSKHEG